MTLDTKMQQDILTEVVSKTAFPGSAAHTIAALLDALRSATIAAPARPVAKAVPKASRGAS